MKSNWYIEDIKIGNIVVFNSENSILEGIITYTHRDKHFIEQGWDKLYSKFIDWIPKTVVYCKDTKKFYRLTKSQIIKIRTKPYKRIIKGLSKGDNYE